MKRQRGRTLKALLTLPFLLLAGCNGTAGRGASDTLVFWNGFSGPDGAMMEKIVAQFNKENPGLRVRMQIIPWATYYDKVTLGLAFGGAPDVFILHAPRLPEYASRGAIEPVDDLYGKGGLDPQDFAPRVLKAAEWQGKRYTVPLDCHPLGLYYNEKLFEEAGIVDENGKAKPPRTYEEFLDAAKKLTKDSDGDGRPDQWGFMFTWLHSNSLLFLNQYGTTLLRPDLKRSALTDGPAEQAMERMLELVDKHKVAPRPEGINAWESFMVGKAAMAMEGVYMMSGLDKQKGLRYAAAPVPQFGPVRAVWGGSHMLCMPKGLTGKRREVASRFMKYLSDHSLKWAAGGQVPVRLSLLRSPEFKKLRVPYALSEQLDYVVLEPPSVSLNQIGTFADAAFEASLNRLKPTSEAFAEASRRIDNVLAREK